MRTVIALSFVFTALLASVGNAAPPRPHINQRHLLLIPDGMKVEEATATLVEQLPKLKEKVVVVDGDFDETSVTRMPDQLLVAPASTAIAWLEGLQLLAAEETPTPGQVGLRSPRAAICVLGREILNLGPGEATLHLAPGLNREARTVTLAEKARIDLHELRRAAWDRAFAGERPIGVPEVPSGALVIVGGGGMPREIAERFFELGGGKEGRFVLLPTAMDPIPPGDPTIFLRKLGAQHVSVITARTAAELEEPETLAKFTEATAVWFGGGRQWRFVDAYEGTKVYDAMHNVLKRGGVIGGSSAGATIQGDYLARGAPAGPQVMMCEGYERGFNFLPGTAIDQHFKQRNRFPDMTALMNAYPQFLGIGLDEATAIVVQGTTAEVLGAGEVHFYDRRSATSEGEKDYQSFAAGKRYDLKARKPLE